MSNRSIFDPLLGFAARLRAKKSLRRFLREVKHARETQDRVLLEKIAKGATSAFGKDHHFERIRSYKDFASAMPVQTYSEIQPYVDRVMAGEVGALFSSSERVHMFAKTSGSTDTPKYVPVTSAFLAEYRRGWNAFGMKALLDHPGGFLRTILQVVSPMDEERTAIGVPCGSISGLLAATQQRIVQRFYVTPRETGYIADPEARYYAIMRFAVCSDVGWLVTASPATQIKLARSAAEHGEQLIRDVRDGTLSPPGDVSDDIARALRPRLKPDPSDADRLDSILREHGELLPRDYWNLAFLANWTGGTMGLHLQDFPRYFGDTPVRDIGLLATEGRVSICLEDGTPAGPVDVGGSFFEFIEADADADDASAIRRCHDVDIGGEYRVIMTTSAGFYRYDIGDRVRVHGFLGEAPIVEFLHRGSRVSSITGEKLTEWQVTAAFDRVRKESKLETCEFVLAPVWDDPPYYRLHLEQSQADQADVAKALDRSLCEVNIEYASKRSSNRLGAVTMNYISRGTFARTRQRQSEQRGGSNEQYKHQYLLTTPGDDRELVAASIESHVSA
jgi:GH3 auxin-responsive promoter